MENIFQEGIIGIYQYKSLSIEHSANYFLTHIFDEKGHLEKEKVADVLEDFNGGLIEGDQIGPFDSLDSLNQFAFNICDKYSAAFITLVSAEEYNSIIRSVVDKDELLEKLLESGNRMENPERGKKGLLGKFFRN